MEASGGDGGRRWRSQVRRRRIVSDGLRTRSTKPSKNRNRRGGKLTLGLGMDLDRLLPGNSQPDEVLRLQGRVSAA